MAESTKAPKAPKESKRRLTLVFDGKYADLFNMIQEVANAEDRDPDTVVLRCLAENLKRLT